MRVVTWQTMYYPRWDISFQVGGGVGGSVHFFTDLKTLRSLIEGRMLLSLTNNDIASLGV